jgi:hypothetical protein
MGHSDLPNGVIYTAVIQRVDWASGLVETANTVYRLGQANEFYQQWASHQNEEQQVPSFVPDARRPVSGYAAMGAMPALRQG